jgi:TPR repeat protein
MNTIFDTMLEKAKQGNTEAQMFIAEAYFKGVAVIRSYTESIYWLTQAAEKNKYASVQIANMYKEGIGVPKDLNKAFEITKKYAEMDNEIQMFNLAGMYLNGIGTEINLELAFEWYEKAFNAGYKDAAYYLGYLYHTHPRAKDSQKAINWYKRAAELNDGRACYNLGVIYYEGSIVPKNNNIALEYLNKAYQLGIKEANQVIEQINTGGYFNYTMLV